MEEKTTSTFKGALYYGSILGVVFIILSVIYYIFDISFEKYVQWISIVVMIAGIYVCAKMFRDNKLDGHISYGKALGVSVLIVLVSSIVSSLFSWLFVAFIDPDMLEKGLAVAEQRLIDSGRLTDDMIEAQMKITRKMQTPPLGTIIGIVSATFLGTIIALITSIFVKNEGDPYQEAMQDVDE